MLKRIVSSLQFLLKKLEINSINKLSRIRRTCVSFFQWKCIDFSKQLYQNLSSHRRLGNRCEIPSISGICRRYPFCGRKFATEPSGRRWIKQPLLKFTNKRHRYRYREYRNHEAWAGRRVASSRLLRFARGSRSRRHRLRECWIDASRCPRNGVPGFTRRGKLAGRTTSS